LLVVVQLLIVKCAIKQTKETRWNFIIYFAWKAKSDWKISMHMLYYILNNQLL